MQEAHFLCPHSQSISFSDWKEANHCLTDYGINKRLTPLYFSIS